MGQAIETVLGIVTSTAATGAQAMTAASGQSFTVRATNGTTTAYLGAVWGNIIAGDDTHGSGGGASIRIRSPRLHDDVVGIQTAVTSANTNPTILGDFLQTLYSQDTLTFEYYFGTAAGGTNVDTACMQIYYDDLPGVAGNYQTWAQVQPQIQSYMGVMVVPESSGTAGQWGAGVALNSFQDVFKANGLYACLGYITPTVVTAWSIQGSDVGNLQVGGPGSIDPYITRRWFCLLEKETGKASIPVINSQNKASTNVFVANSATSTFYPMTLLFAYCGQAQ